MSNNQVINNGTNPLPLLPPEIKGLAADITYVSIHPFETSSGNCFENNKPMGFSFISTEPDGELPDDGC